MHDNINKSRKGEQYFRTRLMACPLFLAVLAWAPLRAEVVPQQQTGTPKAETSELEEVIVTAERRETRLQDTPISASVISARELESQRIVNFSDVQLLVPSLTYTQVTHQEAYFSIRGTSIKNDAPGTDLGVSLFVDDVPMTGIGDNDVDLFDLQSIEVLRGPQGTLFGRNVTGGLVNVHTSAPSFQPSFKEEFTYGSDNLMEARGFATGPLADQLAGKITFSIRRRDDYINNVTLNDKDYGENLGSLRGQLLWLRTDDVKLLLSADYSRDTSQSRVSRLLANFVPSLFPTLQYGPDVTNQALDPRGAKTVWGASAKLDWENPLGTLTSITGYRSVDEALLYSVVGDPANEFKSTQGIHDSQYSEEVHLASAANQHLTWIGGLFYLHSDRASPHFFDVNVVPGTVLSFVPPFSALTYDWTQNQEVTANSAAAFGEATYSFTDALKLTLGARETYERKSGQSQVFDTSGLSPYLAATYAHSWSDFTPKVTLAFEPTSHFLAYATYATGFKSGGYDISASTDAGLAKPFNPEKVKSYEVGSKVTGLDGRLRINGDVYRADYTDLQRTAFDSNTASFVTTNAGSARVQGVEVDGAFAPTSWLTLGANYSYTDAKYLQYVSANDSGPPTVYTGNQLPYVAKNQGNVSMTITEPVGSARGTIEGSADVTYRSKLQLDDANSVPSFVLDRTAFKGVLNLHVGWRSADEKYAVRIWAKNVTNERSVVDATKFTAFFTTLPEFRAGDYLAQTFWTDSRTLGITFTLRQ
jgi:iron complex outermembrane recepter protein